jgi:RNA polymerase sigma-70 factor (ECF subfamily)
VDAGDVYRAHARAVLGYLRGQGVDDPEDVLGEVFLQVARALPRFRGDDQDVRRWVFTIARNRAIDDGRRRRRRPRTVGSAPPDRAAPPAAPPIDAELVRALHRLTPEQREVVVLRFVADLPLDEVALVTGRPVGAVKSMQHRALEQLARIVTGAADAVPGDG